MRLKIKPSMNDTKLNRSQHYIQLVLEIYKRIPNSRKITAKEIQQQLSEVGIVRSERTIQRNLTDIAQFFDDVDVDMRDKPFGYKSSLAPFAFTRPTRGGFIELGGKLSALSSPCELDENA